MYTPEAVENNFPMAEISNLMAEYFEEVQMAK